MIGFEMHLPSGAKAEGMLFTDGSLYVHEPIADTWSSVDDLRKEWPDAVVEIIGPVVAFEAARRELTENYKEQIAALKESYQLALSQIARFEKVVYDGKGSGYQAKVLDAHTGEVLEGVTGVHLDLDVHSVPMATLTVIQPVVEVTVDGDVKLEPIGTFKSVMRLNESQRERIRAILSEGKSEAV